MSEIKDGQGEEGKYLQGNDSTIILLWNLAWKGTKSKDQGTY